MRDLILTIGLNVRGEAEELDAGDAIEMVTEFLGLKNWSVFAGRGQYEHEDGTLVRETSLRFEFCAYEASGLMRLCTAVDWPSLRKT